ncbi:MAG: hypothetical protein ABMA00_15580, partial [Gemmatimonas sp.]
ESKLPTSAEVEAMDVASFVEQAKFITRADSAPAVYFVDGKQVSQAEAKLIEAGRVASVEVVKTNARRKTSEIYIATTDSGLPRKVPMDLEARRAIETKGVLLRLRDSSGLVGVVPPKEQGSLRRTFDGLVVLDGVIVESSVLQRLDAESIGSVEVIKGAAAQRAYADPRAVHGVIKVTTKPKP